jgi:hypothetical protein
LLVRRQPSEMPINVIRRTNGFRHNDRTRALYINCPTPLSFSRSNLASV